ncbi:MAG: plasmid recombination protein [Bacillota bacterium]|nr:plasmid recombination protein [Bacillota bacterium]
MEQYSLSITIGEGNIGHNKNKLRREKLTNVDSLRTELNLHIVDENIKTAYTKLFDESVKKYNQTQKRSDRKIENYYKKIYNSKKEKTFYEFVIQIGNMEKQPNMHVTNQIFTEFVELIQSKYPQIHIFGAYVHNDESTPHLHLDYIPYATYDRGLTKRVSLSKAMTQMGYSFTGKDERDKGLYKVWRNDLLHDFEQICEQHGITREVMHDANKHEKNVKKYIERAELEKEIISLSKDRQSLTSDIVLLQRKYDSTSAKLENVEHEVSMKNNILDALKDEIIENPTVKFTESHEVEEIMRDIMFSASDASNINIEILQERNQKFEPAPYFETNWLNRNVEYVDAKKDLLGRIKEPGFIKISIDEWNKKLQYHQDNITSYNKLLTLYNSIKTKYSSLRDQFILFYRKTIDRIQSLESGISHLRSLPQYTSWRNLSRTEAKYQELKDKLSSLVLKNEEIVKIKNNTIDSLKQKLQHEYWYHHFYEHVLPILHKSKTVEYHSSFDEAIEPYDHYTKLTIQQDLDLLLKPNYKKILYFNGSNGYGWYSSQEEGNTYLGNENDTDYLQAVFPNAEFSDPFNLISEIHKGWER